jgi:cell division protein FtsB
MNTFFNSQTYLHIIKGNSNSAVDICRMKVPRIMVYILFSFVISAALFYFFGSGGLLDYRRLASYRGSLQENIGDLERINSELLSEVQALGSDAERLTLQARELGYFREGERVIRISADSSRKSNYTVGKVLRRKAKKQRADWPFRATALGLPILLALVSVSVRRRKNRETGNR